MMFRNERIELLLPSRNNFNKSKKVKILVWMLILIRLMCCQAYKKNRKIQIRIGVL